MECSGSIWIERFPASTSLADLAEPFRSKAQRFVAALQSGGAIVTIGETFRPPERAYLMHYAWAIARMGIDPGSVPAMAGVEIQWLHPDATAAAEAMVAGYGLVFEPALASRHTQGLAVDMEIAWQGDLAIVRGDGSPAIVASLPRNGSANADLHAIGASYGVYKLISDPPHWSADGH